MPNVMQTVIRSKCISHCILYLVRTVVGQVKRIISTNETFIPTCIVIATITIREQIT